MNDQIFYSSAHPSWSTPSQQQQQSSHSAHQGAPSHSQRHTSSQNPHQQHVQQSQTPGPVDLAHLSSQFAGLTLPPQQQQRPASSSHHGLGHPHSSSSQHGPPSSHHQGPHSVMGPGGGGHQGVTGGAHGGLPPKPSHPLLTPSGRAFAIGGRVQNVSSDPVRTYFASIHRGRVAANMNPLAYFCRRLTTQIRSLFIRHGCSARSLHHVLARQRTFPRAGPDSPVERRR